MVEENTALIETERKIPNRGTMEALEEVRRMKANPSLGKTYTNVDDMMKDLLAPTRTGTHSDLF